MTREKDAKSHDTPSYMKMKTEIILKKDDILKIIYIPRVHMKHFRFSFLSLTLRAVFPVDIFRAPSIVICIDLFLLCVSLQIKW